MASKHNPTNINLKKDLKQFLACRHCKSTLLEEHTFRRTTKDEWSGNYIDYHTITLNQCGMCGKPVLISPPKSTIDKSLIKELIGDGEVEDFLAVEREMDLNQFADRKKRFIQRAKRAAQHTAEANLPPIDPDKPLVTKENG